MTALPPITVTCRHGHEFESRARPKTSVSCPECRKGGQRVTVWVPGDRPKTAREVTARAREREHQDHAAPVPGAELAARWAGETPWDGELTPVPGRETDTCPKCSAVLWWEVGRTLVWCTTCKSITVPPAVSEHYARSHATDVAVREPADPMAERAARVRLRALKQQAEQRLARHRDTIADEEMHDRSQWQAHARQQSSVIDGWITEIQKAESESDLDGIMAHIDAEVLNSELGKALRAEWEQAQQRAARQWEYQQRAAEIEQRQKELDAQREREEREAERAVRQSATPEPRAITTGRTATRSIPDSPYTGVALQIYRMQKRKERAIAERGKCVFKHFLGITVPADRNYYVPYRDSMGNATVYALPNTPQVLACTDHFKEAEIAMNKQGYSDLAWEPANASS